MTKDEAIKSIIRKARDKWEEVAMDLLGHEGAEMRRSQVIEIMKDMTYDSLKVEREVLSKTAFKEAFKEAFPHRIYAW
jgi:hypothetical protein